YAVVHAEAPSIRARRPEVSEGLAAVIARCLAKAPDGRFAGAAALAAALAPFASPKGRSRAATVAAAAGAGARGDHTPGATNAAPTAPARGEAPAARRRMLLLGGFVAVAGVGAILGRVSGADSARPPPSVSAVVKASPIASPARAEPARRTTGEIA